ncbi:MAG: hypothetical protein ACE5G7_03945 [Candidatus Hydrothermarchaeaceae archaeon]
MVAGKTRVFRWPIRTFYHVVACSCGEVYRGDKIGEENVRRR